MFPFFLKKGKKPEKSLTEMKRRKSEEIENSILPVFVMVFFLPIKSIILHCFKIIGNIYKY